MCVLKNVSVQKNDEGVQKLCLLDPALLLSWVGKAMWVEARGVTWLLVRLLSVNRRFIRGHSINVYTATHSLSTDYFYNLCLWILDILILHLFFVYRMSTQANEWNEWKTYEVIRKNSRIFVLYFIVTQRKTKLDRTVFTISECETHLLLLTEECFWSFISLACYWGKKRQNQLLYFNH